MILPDIETINALKSELVKKRESLQKQRQETQALEQAIALLEGNALLLVDANDTVPTSEFTGLSIVDAAKRLMKQLGPLDTPTIAKELKARGLESTSKNWLATVYATLDNSPEV